MSQAALIILKKPHGEREKMQATHLRHNAIHSGVFNLWLVRDRLREINEVPDTSVMTALSSSKDNFSTCFLISDLYQCPQRWSLCFVSMGVLLSREGEGKDIGLAVVIRSPLINV
jgi:hypothetical protein